MSLDCAVSANNGSSSSKSSSSSRREVLLSIRNSPVSFCGQALLLAARSNLLNPPNARQSKISRYLGKPLRSLARLIYAIVVLFICSLAGMIYHGVASLYYWIKSARQHHPMLKAYFAELSKGHINACSEDASNIFGGICIPGLGIAFHAERIFIFASNSENIATVVSTYFNDNLIEEGRLVHANLSHANVIRAELLARA